MPTHEILGGKVKIYRRDDGGENWFCSTYFQGKNRRKSTKTDSLPHAEEIAEGWYLELRGKARAGLPLDEPKGSKASPDDVLFDEAADAFEAEYEISTAGERSPRWIAEHKAHLKNHLRPFFGKKPVDQINEDLVQAYRVHRAKQPALRGGTAESRTQAMSDEGRKFSPPARNTIQNEIITLRLVLKLSARKGWIPFAPKLENPYKRQMKISHRPWFSPDEYKTLYKATRENARTAKPQNKWEAEQLHDLVLFLGNTGMRPDEVNARNLLHQDIKMVRDPESDELILEIAVRGKRGTGYCKSRPDAVKVYQRLLNRPKWEAQGRAPRSKKAIAAAASLPEKKPQLPLPSDPVFPMDHRRAFNSILTKTGLKYDRDKQPRVLYSLRHYYICQRLLEGALPYDVAKNCRTSVEMIEKNYAVHIANSINAAAVNTRRLRRKTVRTPAPVS
jgi:hypothetical protein